MTSFQREYWEWAASMFEAASTQKVVPVILPNSLPLTIPNLLLWTAIDEVISQEQFTLLTHDLIAAKLLELDFGGSHVPMFMLLSNSHRQRAKYIRERILSND